MPEGDVLERFRRELGYCTTKVGADAAVVDGDERLFLVRRADDGCWGLVSGWVDTGEDPRDTVVRELHEETGYHGAVDDLVGIFARPASAQFGPHASIAVVYLCSLTGGAQRVPEHEILDVAWRHVDDVEHWHKNHEHYARAALAHWRQRCGESTS
jgi:ADP-ribose pyrophosphatase YjhB (NUDIX family)